MRTTHRSQHGDTIVEVLIATAVIGMVMTVSFATAQRSLQVGRRAQERTEALKVAESQVEILKSLAPRATPNIFTASSPFCVTATTIDTVTCSEGPDSRYTKAITRTDAGTLSTFNVRVFWDSLRGGQEEVILVYKIHREQFNK
jgi:type II secretory pathway pseudopilin PulG